MKHTIEESRLNLDHDEYEKLSDGNEENEETRALFDELKERDQNGMSYYFDQLIPNSFVVTPRKWNFTLKTKLILLHCKYGNKWSTISRMFPDQRPIGIKNMYFSIIRTCIRTICRLLDLKMMLSFIKKIRTRFLTDFFWIIHRKADSSKIKNFRTNIIKILELCFKKIDIPEFLNYGIDLEVLQKSVCYLFLTWSLN